MFNLMCWTCAAAYYREHGALPPPGYLLNSDGTETAVSMWKGMVVCRVHAAELMVAAGVDMAEDG